MDRTRAIDVKPIAQRYRCEVRGKPVEVEAPAVKAPTGVAVGPSRVGCLAGGERVGRSEP